jgi:hypothetical protein
MKKCLFTCWPILGIAVLVVGIMAYFLWLSHQNNSVEEYLKAVELLKDWGFLDPLPSSKPFPLIPPKYHTETIVAHKLSEHIYVGTFEDGSICTFYVIK